MQGDVVAVRRRSKSLYRVNRAFACPICGRTKWCTFSRTIAVCMRVESARRARNGGWVHRLDEIQARVARKEILRRERGRLLAEMEHGNAAREDTTERLMADVEKLFAMFNPHGYKTRRKYRAVMEELAAYLGRKFGLQSLRELQPEHVGMYIAARREAGDPEAVLGQKVSIISELHGLIPGRLYRGSIRRALDPRARVPRGERGGRLMPQARAVVRRLTGLAYTTRERYAVAWYRFVGWLEERTRIQGLRNIWPEHLQGYVEERLAGGASERAVRWEVAAIVAIHRTIERRRWPWDLDVKLRWPGDRSMREMERGCKGNDAEATAAAGANAEPGGDHFPG